MYLHVVNAVSLAVVNEPVPVATEVVEFAAMVMPPTATDVVVPLEPVVTG